MSIQSTNRYDMFKFRDDNRQVDPGHVNKIVESIKMRNLLHYQPIIVDKDYYVIDGQHRLSAAKRLNLPIYFQVQENGQQDDIIFLNVSKSWSIIDYFNYFVKNKSPEYVKMHTFCKKHGLTPKQVIFLFVKRTKDLISDFKNGKFVFEEGDAAASIEKSIDAIGVLKKWIPTSRMGFDSKKLWGAIHFLCSEPSFDMDIWMRNVGMLAEKIHTKATNDEMLHHMLWVYNYRNSNRIEIGESK